MYFYHFWDKDKKKKKSKDVSKEVNNFNNIKFYGTPFNSKISYIYQYVYFKDNFYFFIVYS